MPNLGLSREDVHDILAHIETKTAEVRDQQALAASPSESVSTLGADKTLKPTIRATDTK